MWIDMAELSNTKTVLPDDDGIVRTTLRDVNNIDVYNVRVVGRPDLRRVRRFYFGVRNEALSNPSSGYFYLNDVRLGGVKRDRGLAQRAGVRLNMADVIKLDFDWKHNDAEYHGLDKRAGTGIDLEDWNIAGSLDVEDFLPLLGFRLPINVSRHQTVKRPKYVTNSDIEILDEDMRNELSSVDTAERFTTRLNHAPSKGALLRYLLDPWSFQLSGSRQSVDGPLEVRRTKSLQGALNYDLRISGNYQLGDYPLLRLIPVVKGLSLVPNKLAFGASFNSGYTNTRTISDDGVVTQRPVVRTRPGKLTGSLDYRPLPVVDLTVTATSDRDLLREKQWNGVNIGEENRRSYDLSMTLFVPKADIMPQSRLMAPLRAVMREAAKLRPTIRYTGSFADAHDPAQRQAGDPEGIRSVSNSGSWDFRLDLPVGGPIKALFPERKFSQNQRQDLINQQQRLEAQSRTSVRPGGGGGTSTPEGSTTPAPTGGPAGAGDEMLTPEEIQRLEEERLLEAAERRLEEEREQGLSTPEEVAPTETAGGGFRPLMIFDPLLNSLRSTTPVKITYSTRNQSNYGRLLEPATFWYQTGLTSGLDLPDTAFASSNFDHQESLSLSSSTKLLTKLSVDVKYSDTQSRREQIGTESRNLKRDWPDAQVSLTGLEKWGVFGGGERADDGWFRTASMNVSYKRTKTVNNFSDDQYNPSVTTTLSPRWNLTFHSGFAATLTANLTWDRSQVNGVLNTFNKARYGLQLRHQFRAEGFLAKLGLYRPGSSQTVSMDVDLSYERDRAERVNVTGVAIAPTGQTRINVNPRFSYQISRNLSGALRFIFRRSNDIATDKTSTTLGLGVEATFVF